MPTDDEHKEPPVFLPLNIKVSYFNLLTVHGLKLLHPAADVSFSDIYVALGIDG